MASMSADYTMRVAFEAQPPKLDRAALAATVRDANFNVRKAIVMLDRAGIKHSLAEVVVIVPPAWRPGDVVVVRYVEHRPYTYVRGNRGWLREFESALTDADIDTLYREGKAKPVLQRGGEPFALGRVPA